MILINRNGVNLIDFCFDWLWTFLGVYNWPSLNQCVKYIGSKKIWCPMSNCDDLMSRYNFDQFDDVPMMLKPWYESIILILMLKLVMLKIVKTRLSYHDNFEFSKFNVPSF